MISVFTPTHKTTFLMDAYHSLLGQTYSDWEWIIVPNGEATGNIPPVIERDSRVRIFPFESSLVGELKKVACSQATGDLLVELDHDDLLTPDCLAELSKAEGDFIYSNCIQVDMNWQPYLWGDGYGWIWRPVEYKEHQVLEAVQPPAYPSNFSRIWFAPNHVRAWRREFYERIGGHDATMHISDDHDLCARSYLNGSITHIDKPLYIYRVHGQNSWLGLADEIERTMWDNHDKYFIPMQEKWTKSEGLRLIDLGGAIDCPSGYESYDRHNADIVGDLNDTWKLETSSVGILRAHDVVEHLHNPIHTMNEAHRVLAHGGVLDLLVPSTDGKGAWCDPTHVSFWNSRSIRYYTEASMRRYIEPECTAKFQVVKVADQLLWNEGLPYVQAHLLAIKEATPRYHGALLW